jgi:hypothetical protein
MDIFPEFASRIATLARQAHAGAPRGSDRERDACI